jgi:single-strand DNA-binding protein
VNSVVLIGRLTRDPELRYVPSGQPVANFTLAVDRPFAASRGAREADFVTIVAWRKAAELVSTYLEKGRLVAIEGRLQIRTYETQDGRKQKAAEVVANRIQFLDRKKGRQADGEQAALDSGTDTAGSENSAQPE